MPASSNSRPPSVINGPDFLHVVRYHGSGMTVLLRHRDRLTHECVEAVSGWDSEKCRVDYKGS